MGLVDLESNEYTFVESPIESKRFQIDICRGTVGEQAAVDGSAIRADYIASKSDVAFLRYHASHTGLAAELRSSEIEVLLADSLLYFGTAGLKASSLTSELVPVDQTHWTELLPVVTGSFAEYGNHYSANPLFHEADILAGYLEWAHHHLLSPDCAAFAIRANGAIASVAFIDESSDTVEISLASTAPDFQRQGYYAKLIAGIEGYYAATGADRLVISTQSHNVGVIRAWESAGWRYLSGFHTVHLSMR